MPPVVLFLILDPEVVQHRLEIVLHQQAGVAEIAGRFAPFFETAIIDNTCQTEPSPLTGGYDINLKKLHNKTSFCFLPPPGEETSVPVYPGYDFVLTLHSAPVQQLANQHDHGKDDEIPEILHLVPDQAGIDHEE